MLDLNNDFMPFSETPTDGRNVYRKLYIDKMLEKIKDYPSGWYCIGDWDNFTTAQYMRACGKQTLKGMRFKSWQDRKLKRSKLYVYKS
jgi:hypothetical protein